MDSIRRGTYTGPRGRRLAEGTIWCFVCGRPLGDGEDFGPWRIRAVRTSSLWDAELRCICPAHYNGPDGAGPPRGSPFWTGPGSNPARRKREQG